MSDAKFNAARAALDFVKPGMKLGLGTGSTAAHFVRLLGERVKAGLDVVGVPTSEATRLLALEVGVPLLEVDAVTALDLCVDGADEIDGAFRMIKGGGGALLREKIIAAASAHVICIADESKRVETLGAFPLPVEVTQFGYTLTAAKIGAALRAAGCGGDQVVLRERPGGGAFVTDGGNYVLDAHAARIPDADALAEALNRVVGVVEHGLFIGIARTAVLGSERGAQVTTR